MFDRDVDLQNLNEYFEDRVISGILEQLCQETLEEFKDHPGKTHSVAVSILCNVPVIGHPGRMNVICFYRARKQAQSNLCEVAVDHITITETIPDEILDAYNFCRKTQMNNRDF